MTTAIREGLKAKHVYLRPTAMDDIGIFSNWRERADPQAQSLTVAPIKSVSYWEEEFKQNAGKADVIDLALTRIKDDGIIARLTITDLNLLNRSCRLTIAADPEMDKLNDLQEGLSALLDYVFRQFNLNSVYASALQLDKKLIETFESLGFKRDGVLRQRHFFNGAFHDIYEYSLLRYEANL